ncbi:MAG: winged helix-turn-helix domain-containing protein [Kiritimatiellia bacterium]|jgi:predicted transcriptional regulator
MNVAKKNKSNKVDEAPWTFLTNHSHVLLTLAAHPEMVMREIALAVGITERTVQKIIEDLTAAGVIRCEKVGRRNRYRINRRAHLRHPVEAHRKVADILDLVES